MSATFFLALLPFSSYVVAFPFIRAEWGLSNAEAASVFSAYIAGLAVASLTVVPLTDRHPPERIVISGACLLGASNVLFPCLAEGFWSGAALRFLAGAGHVTAYFPGIRLVSRRFSQGRRGTAVATFAAAGYLGTTLSYALTAALLDRRGSWRGAYLETALIGIAAVPLAWFLLRGYGAGTRRASRGRLVLVPLRDRALVLVSLAYGLHAAEIYLARLWLPLLLGASLVWHGDSSQNATTLAASLSGLMFSTGVAGVFVGGVLSDKLGRTRAGVMSFAVSGACSFAIGWLVSVPPAILIAVGLVYGFATAADSSIYATAVTELSPPETLGSAQALQSFSGYVGAAIAPVLGGVILDGTYGHRAWVATFGLNGLLAVAGVIALVVLRRMPRARVMAGGKC